jgi:hypothetical protein
MNTLHVAAGAIRRDETVEIVLRLVFAGGFIVVGILHNRLPDIAETLGIPVVALLIVLLRCEAAPREVIR